MIEKGRLRLIRHHFAIQYCCGGLWPDMFRRQGHRPKDARHRASFLPASHKGTEAKHNRLKENEEVWSTSAATNRSPEWNVLASSGGAPYVSACFTIYLSTGTRQPVALGTQTTALTQPDDKTGDNLSQVQLLCVSSVGHRVTNMAYLRRVRVPVS